MDVLELLRRERAVEASRLPWPRAFVLRSEEFDVREFDLLRLAGVRKDRAKSMLSTWRLVRASVSDLRC